MTTKQIQIEQKIRIFAKLLGVDPDWAVSIALIESSLGENQKSLTGCLGVFQMSSIAMKDLWLEMGNSDDDEVDILCGLLFMRLLEKRHGSKEKATAHFCDPDDREWYVPKVMSRIEK